MAPIRLFNSPIATQDYYEERVSQLQCQYRCCIIYPQWRHLNYPGEDTKYAGLQLLVSYPISHGHKNMPASGEGI